MTTTLKMVLGWLTVRDLKHLSGHIPGADSGGRKEQLIERIVAGMRADKLKAIWSRLDETQQAAVAEAVHDPNGEYSAQRFSAKYRHLPSFEVEEPTESRYYDPTRSALALFIHKLRSVPYPFVPADLAERLRTFVPPPPPVSLNSAEAPQSEADLTLRLTEREALQEVVVMLRTLGQTRIQVGEKTAHPSGAAMRLVSEKLAGGDFYAPRDKQDEWAQDIGPIKAFAWPMLLQAGGLAHRAGGRLALSPAGVKALSTPPAEVLRGLWRKWVKSTLLDEFNRVDAIKGQHGGGHVMTAVAGRRATIEDALRECPPGRWVALEEFSCFMQATDQLFEVTHDRWKLYLQERQYGSLGYDGSGGWNILQMRYIAALLFEYAATLGMVDVAYTDPAGARDDFHGMWGADDLACLSRYDGLREFRLTALGAYALGIEARYQPLAVPSSLRLSVLPSLLVNVRQGNMAAEEALLLENWAEAVDSGSWRLSREKALAAIEKGYDIAELRAFLESRDDMPLPEPVDALILGCERNGKALKSCGNAVLIECLDDEIAQRILQHRETAALCASAGAKTLVVRAEHVNKFRERVRVLGYGMVI